MDADGLKTAPACQARRYRNDPLTGIEPNTDWL